MNGSEKENLHKEAVQVIERTGHFIKDVSTPQIQAYASRYNRYLENIATASGVFAGATVALLSSRIEKVYWLAVVGFILEIISVLKVFLVFKRDLALGAPFIQKIRKIENEFTKYSYTATMFTRGEIGSDEFIKEKEEMRNSYHSFRDMSSVKAMENSRDKELQEIDQDPQHSQLSKVTLLFFTGLIAIAFSILWPALIKIFS